ncbi:XdhC/CoxI family protein [Opitutus sp. ER46]|uniref:XdhC family protein n=1 Tax=Opitutus sp. ER46 TaxID=2161864 RepID=UPI000D317AD5|nr:XdhC/CoxI family protein [Opitutus sp. ER46]PTX91504.1 xanthine dehydrogenase [Opitutus sp. ER46]
MKEIQAIVGALIRGRAQPAALATLVSVTGSSYRRPGARLLLLADGTHVGSISGGCLEQDVIERAQRVLTRREPDTVVYDTTSENDIVWGVGLGCQGVVRLLIEPLPERPAWAVALADNFTARRPTHLAITHRHDDPHALGTALTAADAVSSANVFVQLVPPPVRLVVFGAGDDAQPLVRFATELGWETIVADPRATFASPARFPSAARLVVQPPDQLADAAGLDAHSLVVVMTHHYVHDLPLLRALLPRPLAYLGLLGPRKRADRILADLAAGGLTLSSADRARLHAPIGLDLGADGPEQVALAIVAEIQACLAQRSAAPLHQVFATPESVRLSIH